MNRVIAGLAAAGLALASCGGTPPQSPALTEGNDAGSGHGHSHAAPRGGTLVEVGDHAAQMEFILDPPSGRLAAFLLDGCAEKPVRIAQPALELDTTVTSGTDTTTVAVTLFAVANPLTGEKAGDTSQFEGAADALRGASAFDATVREVVVHGSKVRDIRFGYPKGKGR
jgi:hypothetical protein